MEQLTIGPPCTVPTTPFFSLKTMELFGHMEKTVMLNWDLEIQQIVLVPVYIKLEPQIIGLKLAWGLGIHWDSVPMEQYGQLDSVNMDDWVMGTRQTK